MDYTSVTNSTRVQYRICEAMPKRCGTVPSDTMSAGCNDILPSSSLNPAPVNFKSVIRKKTIEIKCDSASTILRIRVRMIRVFFGLLDPSIIKQK